jgi:hypothetical protein
VTVDNARDLVRPQDEDPRPGDKRSASWSAYAAVPDSSRDNLKATSTTEKK